ncbi:MAG: hypothetical protein JWO38_3772 [Gemmataceae bacterium]|nr:hypothetical protein [Gemmataceae bacterium]
MRKRIAAGLVAVAAGIAVVAGGSGSVTAQPKTDKGTAPKYLYAHDLAIRPGGESEVSKAVKIGIEWYQYQMTDGEGAAEKTYPFTIVVTETGSITVFPAGPVGGDKSAKRLYADDIRVRKAGEPEFTQQSKVWGVEVFRDNGSERLFYVSEAASVASAPIPESLVTTKGPKWHHALEPKVRLADQQTFDKAKKFGLEVSTDENTGGLLYVTETGAIATAAAPTASADPKKPLGWKPEYGYVLQARTADEVGSTNKTRRIALEVITDETTGNFIYITETGSLAVVPNPGKLAAVKGPEALTWLGWMSFAVRKGGEKSFEKAKRFKVEVYRDNRTGNLMFLSETGAIAVLPK